MTLDEFKKGFTHHMHIPIAWNDMDALAHVNNTKYFLYYESARVDFLEKYESLIPMPDEEIGPILAYIDCQFLVPLTFPDEIVVGSRISGIGNTSIKLEQEIFSLKHGIVAAVSKSVIVLVNYKTGAKIAVPEVVRALIQQKM